MIRSRSSRTCSSAEGLVRLLALTLLAAALPRPAAAAADPSDRLLLARPFPIEAAPSFPGALFHWIDSLAGTSNGKTIPVHQQEYVELFGPMTDADKAQLDAFVAARAEHLQRLQAAAARGGPPAKFSALLGTFCSSATVEEALDRAKDELSPGSWNGLAGALAYFRPKYERIWHDGEIPKAFLARARSDPSVSRLESLLARIVRFYQVDPLRAPPPRLALVPVRPGGGTHAEAIGGVLLLEIRAGAASGRLGGHLRHDPAAARRALGRGDPDRARARGRRPHVPPRCLVDRPALVPHARRRPAGQAHVPRGRLGPRSRQDARRELSPGGFAAGRAASPAGCPALGRNLYCSAGRPGPRRQASRGDETMSGRIHERGEGRIGLLIALALFGSGIFLGIKIIPVRINAYEFRDFIQEECRFAAHELRLPLDKKNLTMERTMREMVITAKYEQVIDLKVTKYVYKFDHEERAPLF
jgi:hypothetical protein